MLEKHGIACDMMHGFNWDKWTTVTPIGKELKIARERV